MAHSSQARWSDIDSIVSSACSRVTTGLLETEADYQDLLELHAFAGGTAQLLADQLFADVMAAEEPPRDPAVADTAEVAKTQDAIDAMLALHQLFEAATNVAVTAADRMDTLRRFT